MSDKYFLADSIQMGKREALAIEFYNSVLDADEIPFIVTDEASLYDIYIGDEQEIIQKIKEKYGITIDVKYLRISFWKLLDYIEKNRTK